MLKKLLSEGWKLEYEGADLPAKVPFSLYHDLLENGLIEDPFYRDNEAQALPLAERDCTYRLSFNYPEGMEACKEIYLHLDGVDTIADILVNGETLYTTDNMYRSFDLPVMALLKRRDNLLEIHFHSPVGYIQSQIERHGAIPCNTDTLDGFNYIRKSACMMGWDFAPKLPDMGLYKEVSLRGTDAFVIRDVSLCQEHADGRVRIVPRIHLKRILPGMPSDALEVVTLGKEIGQAEDISCVIKVITPEAEELIWENPEELIIEYPQLWWPSGYGEQPLYRISVEVFAGGRLQDVWEKQIGLRQMGIRQETDAWGISFAHEINGVAIFAMGADYIPEDALVARTNRERTRSLLLACKAANYNAIRVWGGGYYPDESFYDLCDELGLVVWQDLMFTCSTYLLTPEFEENITAEIKEVLRRIRHHACLGLVCGNNEMEGFLYGGVEAEFVKGHPMAHRLLGDYTRMYETLIPKLMRTEAPDVFYWPSSPSSGGDFDAPQDTRRGDAHYWEVWHGYKPFPAYRAHTFRYASEFGFESLPAVRSIETFTRPEERNLFSYVMEKHQRSREGGAKLMHYVSQYFRYPEDFSALVYISQLMQADAMRYAVEHYRRHRGQCMGALVWQLNDCWPVASWSSIDYFGRWKALHYYEKRFFAPILLSCEEEGLLTQDPNPNARPYAVKKSIRLNLSNETRQEARVRVEWSLRDAASRVIGAKHIEQVCIPPLRACYLEKVELPQARLFTDHVHFACYIGDELYSEGSVLFSMPKYYRYEDPDISVVRQGDELLVRAKAYAKGVEIQNGEEDLLLSDNYFDMEAGEKRVKIIGGDPTDLRIRSVYDAQAITEGTAGRHERKVAKE